MPLPRAVQEAEELANRLQEELYAPQQQQTEQPQPTDGDQPAAPVAQETPATPAAPAAPAPAQEDGWEHRFKVLQGKYNSEVPRVAAENRELKGQLTSMQKQIDEMKAEQSKVPLVKPEEIAEYGEGLIDVARRIAREENAELRAANERLQQQLDGIQQTTATKVNNDFFTLLTQSVPDWEAINADPKFLTWLDEVDEFTGESRQALLSRAEQSRDAVRTAKFFTSFKKASQTWAAQPSALDQQVTPPASPAPASPSAKRTWTRGEIADFYARQRRGSVSDAEAIAIEAEIHAATIEGRVR